jgi:transcriptional regulator with XRE-family HTH domain
LLWYEQTVDATFETVLFDRLIFVQNLGKSIRKHRLSKNYSLEYVALKTGLNYSHLSKIERAITIPSAFHLFIISNALNIPVCKLLNDSGC